MTHHQLLIAANTIWVVVAAVLVMFMQAGFALLEAGLTRMKNAAHIAGKNVLIFGVASLVYWLVGFGLAFGNGNGFVGGLVTMTLNRIIFDGHGGAKTAERWDVGHRIRDVEEGPDGSLWMLEDANPGALIHVTPKAAPSAH